jgi:hypothetical protein
LLPEAVDDYVEAKNSVRFIDGLFDRGLRRAGHPSERADRGFATATASGRMDETCGGAPRAGERHATTCVGIRPAEVGATIRNLAQGRLSNLSVVDYHFDQFGDFVPREVARI